MNRSCLLKLFVISCLAWSITTTAKSVHSVSIEADCLVTYPSEKDTVKFEHQVKTSEAGLNNYEDGVNACASLGEGYKPISNYAANSDFRSKLEENSLDLDYYITGISGNFVQGVSIQLPDGNGMSIAHPTLTGGDEDEKCVYYNAVNGRFRAERCDGDAASMGTICHRVVTFSQIPNPKAVEHQVKTSKTTLNSYEEGLNACASLGEGYKPISNYAANKDFRSKLKENSLDSNYYTTGISGNFVQGVSIQLPDGNGSIAHPTLTGGAEDEKCVYHNVRAGRFDAESCDADEVVGLRAICHRVVYVA